MMSDEELRVKVAELCGLEQQWLIIKGGYYYRPRAAGYTSCIEQAGRYSSEEAARHTMCASGEITRKLAPLPDYCHDLNACAEFEKTLAGNAQRFGYLEKLAILLGFDRTLTTEREFGEFSFALLTATARQRCEAFYEVMTGAQK